MLSPVRSGPAIAPEAVVTFDRLDGFRVVEALGTVRGEGAVARNVFRATFRTIGSLIGLTPINYLTDAERARSDALAALVRDAEALGANGVINVRFDANEVDGGTRVRAEGDAVLLDPAPGFVP